MNNPITDLSKIASILAVVFMLCLSSLMHSNRLEGQVNGYRHFTIKEGLPSSFIYDLEQDRNGVIWMAGEEEVSLFDGKGYSKVELEELNALEVVEIEIDSKGRIWLLDLSGKYTIYENGKIRDIAENIDLSTGLTASSFLEDFNQRIWINNFDKMFVSTHDSIGSNRDTVFDIAALNYGRKVMVQTKDSLLYLFSRKSMAIFDDFNYMPQEYGKNTTQLKDPLIDVQLVDDKIMLITTSNIYLFDFSTQEFKIAFPKFNHLWKDDVIGLFKKSESELFISTRNGLVYLEDIFGNPSYQKFFEGTVMGAVLADKEGNHWFCTLKDGIYVLPNSGVKILEKGRTIFTVDSDKNQNLILGSENSYATILNPDFEILFDQKIKEGNYRIYDVAQNDKYITFLTSKGAFQLDKKYNISTLKDITSFKSGVFDDDGTLWTGTSHLAGILTKEKRFKKFIQKRCYSILPTNKEEAWLGTISGLYYYKNGETKAVENEFLSSAYIKDIQEDKEGNLWLATHGQGVLCWSKEKELSQYKNRLASDKVSKILLDSNFIWVATNKGINQICKKEKSVLYLGIDEGLPTPEVTDLHKIEDRIFAATIEGVAFFDRNIELKQEAPIVSFKHLKIAEKDTLLHSAYRLGHLQNNIKIEFSGIIYKNADQVEFQYRMDPLDKDWVSSKINIAQYPSLPHGNYEFRLRARTVNSNWSDEKTISFYIKKPYWQTYLFYFLVIAICFLIGATILHLIINNIKEKNEIRAKLAGSQLTALRSQMNPHFLFNSLNSIQDFIMKENKREANRYLSNFSNLMRNILQMSDQEEISLHQELESLKLYLSLEALRFESNFDYTIEIDESLNTTEILIPPMLIQPFVENAIKHGLMHKKGNKKLYLRFKRKDDFLVCEVEDNGVGRKRSEEIKKDNQRVYPSKAMSLTENRFKLLTIARKRSMMNEVIDLHNENNIPIGTLVKIYIKFDGQN